MIFIVVKFWICRALRQVAAKRSENVFSDPFAGQATYVPELVEELLLRPGERVHDELELGRGGGGVALLLLMMMMGVARRRGRGPRGGRPPPRSRRRGRGSHPGGPGGGQRGGVGIASFLTKNRFSFVSHFKLH